MGKQLQKLELSWIGKGDEPNLEPRILIEDATKGYGVHMPIIGKSGRRIADSNILIHGDNLLALRAIEADFAGEVKCICIDPPYNTGTAFEQYDDGVEHSQWLNLIIPRLRLLHKLLAEDGSIWITIDDNECHYLKVVLDEVFGRKNFVTTIIWQKKYAPKSDTKFISEAHDYILVYAKNIEKLNLNRLQKTEKQTTRYKNPDNDPRGPWKPSDVLRNEFREYAYFPVQLPNGKQVLPPSGTSWRYTKEKFAELIADNRIWFGKDGSSRPAYKRFISEVTDTIPAMSIWGYDEVGHNDEAKKEVRKFNEESVFATPKPERLISRIVELATNKNEIILDSFLGSGTTVAVAHKMNRRWIGVELGSHAITHCLPRLSQVVAGNDEGGISQTINWKGGGGFKFYTLAPSLLRQDQYGNWIIDAQYNADMLAAAMAKQEGFHYSPDESIYWKQGKSSEKDFIFTTTQFVTVEMLDRLQDEMQPDESLLICCKSFKKECKNRHSNITIKKIPQMLLGRCEFGKDDYSLNIVNSTEEGVATEESVQAVETIEHIATKAKKQKLKAENQPELF
ncbi:site-specific DNA-methyltransferase [Segetibacter sp. 3557_3]|uniref:site-specific DNA-methyltransferase n=1 Tax=Segetibacter sp. 3557_3 TaxID=2547429 RepID=UPI001058D05B|nr:site-specific DNA-methyltransferase [Segetibacter sp. 3557_3]TDH23964.1 site-specific DNA-methyltransferase [Segetibacter sp. 3557_3]